MEGRLSGKKVIWRVAYVILKGKEDFLKDFIIELKCEGYTGIKHRVHRDKQELN